MDAVVIFSWAGLNLGLGLVQLSYSSWKRRYLGHSQTQWRHKTAQDSSRWCGYNSASCELSRAHKM